MSDRAPRRPNLRLAVGGDGAAPQALNRDDLVERVRAGELLAWSTLYQDLFPGMVRHVGFLCGDPAVAEDIVQDTFARAMTSVAGFDGHSSFPTWLRGISLNLLRMHWRKRGSQKRLFDRWRRHKQLERVPLPDESHLQQRRGEVLYALLAELPEHLREAYAMRELAGLSQAEAAALLGISEGNLAVRVTRARSRIRRGLQQLGWLEET